MIFLVVGTLVISGVSIRKTADQAAANVRQSLGGGFVMNRFAGPIFSALYPLTPGTSATLSAISFVRDSPTYAIA